MLKSLWDVISLVQSSFRDWNTTLWCDINVEQMEMDCKKFVKASSGGAQSDLSSTIKKYIYIHIKSAKLLHCKCTAMRSVH